LATGGGELVQLQQGREYRERDATEKSATFIIAVEEEVNDKRCDVGEIQDYARRIAGKGKAVNNRTYCIVVF